ncbi:MAG TPA: hypothetical protein DCR21_00125 [Succinivibrionaceae bacterium]|nr:hypothetical protein [Succinivibrionaceae bacterium]
MRSSIIPHEFKSQFSTELDIIFPLKISIVNTDLKKITKIKQIYKIIRKASNLLQDKILRAGNTITKASPFNLIL